MSKNNTIKKSDKKFIRREKARIRAQFLDAKKQEEMINELYKKFSPQPKVEIATEPVKMEKPEEKLKKEEKPKIKKPKTAKSNLEYTNLN